MRYITSRYPYVCPFCEKPIPEGEKCIHAGGIVYYHLPCFQKRQHLTNDEVKQMIKSADNPLRLNGKIFRSRLDCSGNYVGKTYVIEPMKQEEILKKWIKETGEKFHKSTDGKDISMFFHCKNCFSSKEFKSGKETPKMFYLEAGCVGGSASLIRIQCPNCKKKIMDINLYQTQVDVLQSFMEQVKP